MYALLITFTSTKRYVSVILKTLCDKFLENNVTTIIYMTNRLLDDRMLILIVGSVIFTMMANIRPNIMENNDGKNYNKQ